jgi:hypothetical protein
MPSRSSLVLATLLLLFASLSARADSTSWGYGNDSLAVDLALWRAHPDVRVDSFGASALGRPLWMVTISDGSDSLASASGRSGPKRRIFVHARTHPAEVQSLYVAREMIRFLLDTTARTRDLRRRFVFHFVPHYNPDGVALGMARQNANGVDIESNWDKTVLEPEVQALKRVFDAFQSGPVPIEVALNLHSDQFNGKRFFFYHLEAGTSWIYTELQKEYIAGVQAQFPGGIENWDFITSWGTGTGSRYPEGYWWKTQREKVLALTYEDNNSATASRYDSAGRALVLGSVAYLANHPLAAARAVRDPSAIQVGPAGVRLRASMTGARWEVHSMDGRRLGGGEVPTGEMLLAWDRLEGAGPRVIRLLEPGRPVQVRMLGAR